MLPPGTLKFSMEFIWSKDTTSRWSSSPIVKIILGEYIVKDRIGLWLCRESLKAKELLAEILIASSWVISVVIIFMKFNLKTLRSPVFDPAIIRLCQGLQRTSQSCSGILHISQTEIKVFLHGLCGRLGMAGFPEESKHSLFFSDGLRLKLKFSEL